MNKGNKYPDGYRPKIEYWMKIYQHNVVHRFDELKALEKLKYFINKELNSKLENDTLSYEYNVYKITHGHNKTKENDQK